MNFALNVHINKCIRYLAKRFEYPYPAVSLSTTPA
jgi:hypothetical protein